MPRELPTGWGPHQRQNDYDPVRDLLGDYDPADLPDRLRLYRATEDIYRDEMVVVDPTTMTVSSHKMQVRREDGR